MPKGYTTSLPIACRAMTFDFTALAAASGLAALISAAIAIIAWRQRHFPGVRWLALLMAAVSFWAAGAMCELSATNIPAKIFWSKVEYVGTLSTPVLFLLLALEYNRIAMRRRRWLAGLFAIPLLCLLLAFSNEYHGLIWTSFRFSPAGNNLLIYGHGPAFWLGVAGYSYLMMLLGSLLLVRALHFYPAQFRGQAWLLMLSAAAPWLGNILYLSGAFPLQGLDPTPHSFAFTGLVFALDLLYLRLLYLVPVARTRAFEAMGDGIVVIDRNLRILDLNPAAAAMLGQKRSQLQGARLPPPLPSCQLLQLDGAHRELSPQGSDKILEVRVYAVESEAPAREPLMLVMRDVTERRQAEDALRQLNLQLETRLAEIETLQATLREQAVRDPLTGAFNRRYLEESYPRELARCQRQGLPLAIAVIDLDDFKDINDRHGHQAGDEVLQRLAELLRQDCRQADIVCRLGGEEFMILLPGSSGAGAWQRAEQWRAAFSALRHGDTRLQASFSCGLAAYPLHGESLGQLYRRADQALYRAKAAGKNRSLLSSDADSQQPA